MTEKFFSTHQPNLRSRPAQREQRQAVAYGLGASGARAAARRRRRRIRQTYTLAHRVVTRRLRRRSNRIMLLTFSRRAAARWPGRSRSSRHSFWAARRLMTDGMPWSGTFHAIAARLLRDHADAWPQPRIHHP